ncbi:MAG: hypothetical protein FWG41_01815 [Methanomassiliicoccaceae archaeon]|nr:hypothetical protein [Methanomassiliicoccaceae archaeon]
MPDESQKPVIGSIELLKILMLTGAVVGIFSVFQPWFSMDFFVAQFDYNGFDFLLKSFDYPEGYPGVGYYAYMPLIVLAASGIALAASLLTFTKRERKGAIAGIVLGAVMLVSTLLYIFYPLSKIVVSTPVVEVIADMKLMNYLGGGVYCALIASVFLVIGGAVILMKKTEEPAAEETE